MSSHRRRAPKAHKASKAPKVSKARKARKYPFWNNWRHIAAFVYLSICLFDFIGMPVFYEVINPRTSDSALVGIVQKLPSESQVQALQILHEERTWKSLTLQQGGLFHMAFGAILGAAAFTRGQEKTWYARNGQPYGGYTNDDDGDNDDDNNNDDNDNNNDDGDDEDNDGRNGDEPYFAPAKPNRASAAKKKAPPTPDPFAGDGDDKSSDDHDQDDGGK